MMLFLLLVAIGFTAPIFILAKIGYDCSKAEKKQ